MVEDTFERVLNIGLLMHKSMNVQSLKALSKSLNIKVFSFMSSITNVETTIFRPLLKMVLTKVQEN
jgi:hypothetical protein